jgi:hypothetical protein
VSRVCSAAERPRIEGGAGNHPSTFTMLMAAHGPDAAPYHNRQVGLVRLSNGLPGST